MALNIATFKTRSLTAAIFVVVMLAGLLWNYWSFFLLFSIIHFGCWHEYRQLTGRINAGYTSTSLLHRYAGMIAGWCIMLYFTGSGVSNFGVLLSVISLWLGGFLLLALFASELLVQRAGFKNTGYSMLGLLYISMPWGLLMDLRTMKLSLNSIAPAFDPRVIIPCGLVFSIWINDTMAYVVGSLIGKTPFSKISPKKTWEGTAGGAMLCIGVMALLGAWTKFYTVKDWAFIAAIAAVAGTAGDLLESKLKRLAGVKDSGSLLPGHGGFLDRFDSLLLATPFVWLYVKFFMR